jgi:hypothetical protein
MSPVRFSVAAPSTMRGGEEFGGKYKEFCLFTFKQKLVLCLASCQESSSDDASSTA